MQIQYKELLKTFEEILQDKGFEQEDAHAAAMIFANNSLDGIYSHGVNRFPKVVDYIIKGHIDPNNRAECETAVGAFERWNGKEGLGPLNAKRCMDRAVTLSKEYGIGIVALRNTNHWMRGGTYGWLAADQGCVGMCFSNTMPNMPAWGGKERRIGNNPFILAIPRSDGRHVVADLAMSQFSYGKIEESRLKGVSLPVMGGYDTEGNLTDNPAEIEKTWRVLPIGFWKGSGLSIAFDLIAAVLSAGNTVSDIGKLDDEHQLSQVFIAINQEAMNSDAFTDSVIQKTVDYIKSSEPAQENGQIYYPGEIEYGNREKNLKDGIPVIDSVWERIQQLKK